MLVVLREYGSEKKARKCSILEYLEQVSSSNYQLKPPSGSLEYLLLNGRAVVIFDGLDELLETRYRMEISNDIESFSTMYPSVPIVVTSRLVGYDQAPLDESKFEVFNIARFDEIQVKEYATKWFSMELDITAVQIERQVNSFMLESDIVPDLRSNPLMLALMCNIYRGENYIPRNRPDVYEKCAVMLFERWDTSRGIHVNLPFEAHIKPAMMYLAHWIYINDNLQGGVSESQLVTEAAKYLLKHRFENEDEATFAAKDFIEFCRGRAWVFTDTGTTKEGENLYQFTHRTFLEYFTAQHLVRLYPTEDKLLKILMPRIIKGEWDVVAQLAIQVINKNVEGAGDKILLSIIADADERKNLSNPKLMELNFAARCLQFIVPNPKVTRGLTNACIQESINIGVKSAENRDKRKTKEDPNLLESLMESTVENNDVMKKEIISLITNIVNNGDEINAVAALEIGFTCYFRKRENVKSYEEIAQTLLKACKEKIKIFEQKYPSICLQSFYAGETRLRDFEHWFGIEALFKSVPFYTFTNSQFMPVTSGLWHRLIAGGTSDGFDLENALSDLAEILIREPPPWIEGKDVHYSFYHTEFLKMIIENSNRLSNVNKNLSGHSLFGTFILTAIVFEGDYKATLKIISFSKKRGQSNLTRFIPLFKVRNNGEISEEIKKELKDFGFDPEEQKLALAWSSKTINFVK